MTTTNQNINCLERERDHLRTLWKKTPETREQLLKTLRAISKAKRQLLSLDYHKIAKAMCTTGGESKEEKQDNEHFPTKEAIFQFYHHKYEVAPEDNDLPDNIANYNIDPPTTPFNDAPITPK